MSNKERILMAASQTLLEKGIEGLSVRAISQKAGLSTIAIYSHFQGKQGVLDALYVEGFGLVRDAMVSAADIEDPVEALMAGSQKYLDIALHNEGHYRLIFGETGSSYAPSDEAVEASREAFHVLVLGVTRLLRRDASQALRQRAALRVWAVLHGYVSLRHHVIGPVMDYRQWHAMAMEALTLTVAEISKHGDPAV
ncbi:TetR/AcrR family transcriptional regulator [Congregibacter sp.]|uniref:TetR/AcrR family transcriptional regulator n=1 Tax=Congregibacter sp. TaxID=2744308 RepID=UPI0039E3DC02